MNKTILVTGASRGIGRAIAHAFADCGYHVFLNCNSSVKQLREVQQEIEAQYPGAATCVPGNIGNPDDVRNIFKSITTNVMPLMCLSTMQVFPILVC